MSCQKIGTIIAYIVGKVYSKKETLQQKEQELIGGRNGKRTDI
ncbi:MAG: hypothetical protein RR446_08055 [Lachnospiraceae bacterium]